MFTLPRSEEKGMKLATLGRTPDKTKKVVACGIFNLLVAILLAVWSELDDSLTTWCLAIVLFFNVLACACTVVSQRLGIDLSNNDSQTSKSFRSDAKEDDAENLSINNVAYSFGYARVEVLATFAACSVAQLAAFASAKEAIERFVYTNATETRFTLLAACVFALAHTLCWRFALRGRPPFASALNESPSSVLQEQASVLCESMANVLPNLATRYCLPRVDAFGLLGALVLLLQCVATVAVRAYGSSVADNVMAMAMSVIVFCTMLPIAILSATILLQTTPTHVAGQLDAALREASTLDGVLEFRNEHFWTVAFRRRLVGALHIRVRRDANEAAIVRCVRDKLSPFIADLTVQVTKDRAVPTVAQPAFAYAASGVPMLLGNPAAQAPPNAAFAVQFAAAPQKTVLNNGAQIASAVTMKLGLPDLVQPVGSFRPGDRSATYQ